MSGEPLQSPWLGLPHSNLLSERRLLGVGALGADEEMQDVLQSPAKEVHLPADCEALWLAASHMVLQSYLREPESVLGVHHFAAPGASLLVGVSHIYAEDDEPAQEIIGRAAGHLEGLRPTADAVLRAHAARSPLFFFESVRVADPREVDHVLGRLSALPARPLRVVRTQVARHASMYTIMWSETERRLGLSEFERRLSEAAQALSTGREATVAEIRNRLASAMPAPPDVEVEARLAAVWAQVLGVPVEQITPNASYFDLGGNSLNAFNLANRIRREFHHDISIRDIVEHATLRGIAKLVALDR